MTIISATNIIQTYKNNKHKQQSNAICKECGKSYATEKDHESECDAK